MNGWIRYAPALAVTAAVFYLVLVMSPPADAPGGMHVYEFGRLPVSDNGRVKPLDSVARNSLMQISERQYYVDNNGNTQPAIRWLLDVMTTRLSPEDASGKPDAASEEKVFRIDNDQVLSMLGLEPRSDWKYTYRYAASEFAGKVEEVEEKADAARAKEASARDLVDRKVVELDDHLRLFAGYGQLLTPLVVPPKSGTEGWSPLMVALQRERQDGQENASAHDFGMLLVHYAKKDPGAFNRALAEYRQKLEKQMPAVTAKADFEVFFNNFAPFYQCCLLYVAAFLLVCFSWVGWTGPLNRAAFWLLGVTLLVHGFAMLSRMYLLDRWFVFVINLYSSAVFIGWVGALMALVLEVIFKNGIGTLVAAVIGFVTSIIAHNLAAGDTLEQLRAVLDTNFWLATHVTCVTMGYAATFVAGLLGIVFILRGVLTRSLDRGTFVSLAQAIYGVVCFATLLSFTGTVLGGIWADQSWGRFWGWDPKENGALLIVIWNALILHARWGGMVKQRGMAVLAVFGNIVTLWSWFGVNMLGVGLHSYGWMAFNAVLLATFIPFHLLVIGLGLIPTSRWRSFGTVPPPAPKPHEAPRPHARRGSPAVTASI